MIRLGLCCIFRNAPIKFRTTTYAACSRLSRSEVLLKISEICRHNAEALQMAIDYCSANGIGAFRVNSQILPLKTHPEVKYRIKELPDGDAIINLFRKCGKNAAGKDIRLLFHPDQFILLSSDKPALTAASFAELDYQAEVSEWVGADVINIHGGGAYGDKASALEQVYRNIKKLPDRVRRRLTLENDDRTYTPADLLPLCHKCKIPLIYDAHHHRCLPDTISIEQTTAAALATWNREPVFHLSSPLQGWKGPRPQRHHDYISISDFPECWSKLDVTVEIEAKAKELAIARLRRSLLRKKIPVTPA